MLKKLTLFSLKCFLDAAMMGSISESARRNFVSQSAVSQAIQKLEATLGVPLTVHKKQLFKLTPQGEIVAEQAKHIFSSVRRLQDVLDQYSGKPGMPLHFVTTHSIGLSLLPDVLRRFRATYPEIETSFLLGGLTQIKGWLKQGIAEFALALAGADLKEYQSFSLYTGAFCMYRHRKETRSIDQAGVYVEHREGFMVEAFDGAYRRLHHKPLPIAQELNSWELIARSIELSKGYGLLPDLVVRNNRFPHLVPVTAPSLSYSLQAIYPKGESLSYTAKSFLDIVQESLSS